MKRRRALWSGSFVRIAAAALIAAWIGSGCMGQGADSNTNFLRPCSTNEACGTGQACLCGTCTSLCNSSDDCGDLSCIAPDPASLTRHCGSPLASLCTLPCTIDADCGDAELECIGGGCLGRKPTGRPDGEDGGGIAAPARDASSEAGGGPEPDAGDVEEPPTSSRRTLSAHARERLRDLSPLGAVPPDPTNAYADDPAAAALGQMFFFDPAFSGPIRVTSPMGVEGETGKVACSNCHEPPTFSDIHSDPPTVSQGTGVMKRNAPTLINSAFHTWTGWGGRFAAQWELPTVVSEHPDIMNGSRLQIAHRIFEVYRTEYEAVFGTLE